MTQIAAFFDLDDTIITGTNSLMLYVRYLVENGHMSRMNLVKGVFFGLLHKINLINVEKLIDEFAIPYAGKNEQKMWEITNDWFQKKVKKQLSKEAYQKILWHKQQNHLTVLLSSASQFVCLPVKDYLHLDHSLHSIVEVQDGTLTGKFKKPLCYKEGKVLYAQDFCQQHSLHFEKSYFYTDSVTDLPMLQLIQNPVAINPDPLLKRHAQKNGWPIEYWRTPLNSI